MPLDIAPVGSEHDAHATLMRLLNHLPGLAYRCRINNDYSKSVLEFASKGSYDLLGMSPEELVRDNFNTFERMTLPSDLHMVKIRIRDSIVAHTPYQLTYRLALPSGAAKWIWDQGEAVYDQNGNACYLEGIIMDVSEQKFQELALQEENRQLKFAADRLYGLGPIVGKSDGMRRVYRRMLKAAETDTNVIIYGETGCGKDLVARTIHGYSGREGAYIRVNCGAMTESLMDSELFGHEKGAFTGAATAHAGFFEQARGGTLFLDEVGELSPPAQLRLLRVLESGEIRRVGGSRNIPVDVRVISATHRNLWDMVRRGLFREDLLFRLEVFTIEVPSLGERHEDIPLLAEHFYHSAVRTQGLESPPLLTGEFMMSLQSLSWPGNVRQLRHAVERAVILGHAAKNRILTLAPQDATRLVITDFSKKSGRGRPASPPPDPERIRAALLSSGNRIQGSGGAAATTSCACPAAR